MEAWYRIQYAERQDNQARFPTDRSRPPFVSYFSLQACQRAKLPHAGAWSETRCPSRTTAYRILLPCIYHIFCQEAIWPISRDSPYFKDDLAGDKRPVTAALADCLIVPRTSSHRTWQDSRFWTLGDAPSPWTFPF